MPEADGTGPLAGHRAIQQPGGEYVYAARLDGNGFGGRCRASQPSRSAPVEPVPG